MLAEWERRATRSEWLQLLMISSDTLRFPAPYHEGPSRALSIDPSEGTSIDRKYHKVVSVVHYIEATGASGAEAVVEACEVFAAGGRRQWLKVAGEEKAKVLEDRLQARPKIDCGVVSELGSFVGYSCVRMAWRLQGDSRVLSLESDAVHVFIARHVVDVARSAATVEVVSGMAHDAVGRLVDDWGHGATAFIFMDHRGTRFHKELRYLEGLSALAPRSQFVADNMLKPGAPVCLWHLLHCRPHHLTTSWSLPEFQSESCEDWMSASECCLGVSLSRAPLGRTSSVEAR